MSEFTLPSDPQLRAAYGDGCETWRAYNARLKRAEHAGLLPRRVYLSSVRFGYRRDELAHALEALPRQQPRASHGSAA